MKQHIFLLMTIILLFGADSLFANSAPIVSNVTVSQRTDGSKKVDIRYNLYDADDDKCTISIQVSSDGGSTWTVLAITFLPDSAIGSNISTGTGKQIIWDCGADLLGVFGSNYRIKITADDGVVDGPTGMVWVQINDPGVSGHERFDGQMSKYETTNAQYCQFLNAAKASNQITVYNNVVYATSDTSYSQPYYHLAGLGYTYYLVTNGGASRINYSGSSFTVDSGFGNHPVTYVSWYGATAFCNYYSYRLPTEWEWQAVADYNGSFNYGCGITITNGIANYGSSTHPNGTTTVGAFGTYGYGMADMAGNVWEWTSSISGSHNVFRGGCWFGTASCTVSGRSSDTPYSLYPIVGFRACR